MQILRKILERGEGRHKYIQTNKVQKQENFKLTWLRNVQRGSKTPEKSG